jgi:hypothetical protein
MSSVWPFHLSCIAGVSRLRFMYGEFSLGVTSELSTVHPDTGTWLQVYSFFIAGSGLSGCRVGQFRFGTELDDLRLCCRPWLAVEFSSHLLITALESLGFSRFVH